MKARRNKDNSTAGRKPVLLKVLLVTHVLAAIIMIGAYLSTHISPESFSSLSLLGLGYPIWLIILTGFGVFWAFKKKKYYWISIVTILIGFNHLRHYYAITIFESDLNSPLKVMSYNVKIFDFWNQEKRVQNRNDIFTFLKEENADIICFQEFFHQGGQTDFVTRDSMIKLIETPYYHEHYTHDMAQSRYFGLATFSKYPIVHKGEIAFENDANNFCIYSDILVDQDTIRIFNGHIGSIRFQDDDYQFFGSEGPRRYIDKDAGTQIISRLIRAFEKRAIQSQQIAAEIDSSPYPVIVCMDMNDTPVSYCYSQFQSRLEDAFVESGNGVGTTYIGKMPSNRIDYIFFSESIKVSSFTTHQVNYSDHKPISCQFEVY